MSSILPDAHTIGASQAASGMALPARRGRSPRGGALLLLLALQCRGGSALQLPPLPPLAFHISPQHAAASACIFAAGDLVSQQIEARSARSAAEESEEVCSTLAPTLACSSSGVQRSASAAALGSVYGGLMLPFVYQLAEGLFPGVSPAKVAAKVVVSCSLLSTLGKRSDVNPNPNPNPNPNANADPNPSLPLSLLLTRQLVQSHVAPARAGAARG